jgi:hypothetical protein
MATKYLGGSFAPPITDEKLAAYKALAASAPQRVRTAMEELIAAVDAWWALPESSKAGSKHPTGVGAIVPLEDDHVQKLWDVVPWDYELAPLSNSQGTGVFDDLTGDLRNAAFHLLWFANELTKDREPITADKLKG